MFFGKFSGRRFLLKGRINPQIYINTFNWVNILSANACKEKLLLRWHIRNFEISLSADQTVSFCIHFCIVASTHYFNQCHMTARRIKRYSWQLERCAEETLNIRCSLSFSGLLLTLILSRIGEYSIYYLIVTSKQKIDSKKTTEYVRFVS